jgi:hypothetical protein
MSGVEGAEREDFDDGKVGVGGFRILAFAILNAENAEKIRGVHRVLERFRKCECSWPGV